MVDFLESAFQVNYKKSIEVKTEISRRYGNIVVDETLCTGREDVIGILFGIKKQKSLQIVSIDG